MTDFHTHTLPGIDDGSRSAEQSAQMLSALFSMGFDKVMFTPHYYPDEQSISDFLQKRDKAYKEFTSFASSSEDLKLPSFGFGAEVYLHPILFNSKDEDIKLLTVDSGGRIMLTEMEYSDTVSDVTLGMLNRLIYNFGIIPVLAHIERYPFMLEERNVINMLEMGCLCQINVSSLNTKGIRRKLIKYIRKGYICAIGSDIHSPLSISEVSSGLSELSGKEKAIISHESARMNNRSNIQNFFD